MDLEQIRSENLSKELAYLLGVYLTDGSISSNGWKGCSFSLKSIDKDFTEFTLECLKKILPKCTAAVYLQQGRERRWNNGQKSSECRDQYCLNVGFTELGDFFREQTGDKHHIPYIMWKASLPIKKWFIAGIMDGDGWISKTCRPHYHNINNPRDIYNGFQFRIGIGGVEHGWIHEFKELLHGIGVQSLKTEIRVKNRNIPFVSFGIKIDSFVTHGLFFTIRRKQDRVQSLRNVQRLNVTGPTGSRQSPIFTET